MQSSTSNITKVAPAPGRSTARVAVVGAGISGLSAAKRLHDRGVEVLVLEAQNRPGGRLYTINQPGVGVVDIGGMYVGPGHNRIYRLLKEFGLDTFKLQGSDLDLVHYREGKITRFQGSPFSPASGPLTYLDMNDFYTTLDKLGQEIPADTPWDAPRALEWDQITVMEWMKKQAWTKATIDSATNFLKINLGVEPREISLLYALWYIKSTGGVYRIQCVEGGNQERKMVKGAGGLYNALANHIGLDRVKLNEPVTRIEQNSTGSIITTSLGNVYEVDHVILAIAPVQYRKIQFSPPLPPIKAQLSQRLFPGSIIKTMMYYDRPYWRERGMGGTIIVEDEDLDMPVDNAMDDTKPNGVAPALIGFICADKARYYANMTYEERKQKVTAQYAKLFQCEEMLHPVDYVERVWLGDEWTGGCFVGVGSPGVLTTYCRTLREPHGEIYFAGTETARSHVGYMEGGIEAGERAAKQVMYAARMISLSELNTAEVEEEGWYSPIPAPSLMSKFAPSVGGFIKSLGVATVGSLAAILVKSKL